MKRTAAKTTAKRISAVLLTIGALLLPISQTVHADGISIYVNDVPLNSDVAPLTSNGRTMLPLRACAEALDATVNYSDGIINMHRSNVSITLQLGSAAASINGSTKQLDAIPMVIENRTLVPLRFIGEAFSCPVQWDGTNRAVYIRTTDSTRPFVPQDIPSEMTIANQVLQQINSIRLQKQLEALIPITEMADMAEAHSIDMAANDFIGPNSPANGSTTERAATHKLPHLSEVIAQVDYTTATVSDAVNAWFREETARSILLNPSAAYIGIGVEHPVNSTEVYLTAEILPSWAYFINMPPRSTVTVPELRLQGRSTNLTETITVYKLSDANEHMFSEKQTFDVSVSSNRFLTDIVLWGEGEYAVSVANSVIYITYDPQSKQQTNHRSAATAHPADPRRNPK